MVVLELGPRSNDQCLASLAMEEVVCGRQEGIGLEARAMVAIITMPQRGK